MDINQLEDQLTSWELLKFYSFYKDLTAKPRWHLAVLTCMDCRIMTEMVSKEPGNVIIIRNAGALLTRDSLRSLLIAIYELEVSFIAVVGHTDCGGKMSTGRMNGLVYKIAGESGRDAKDVLSLMEARDAEEAFRGFENVEIQIQKTVNAIRHHPLIPSNVQTAGFKYDTASGRISKIA